MKHILKILIVVCIAGGAGCARKESEGRAKARDESREQSARKTEIPTVITNVAEIAIYIEEIAPSGEGISADEQQLAEQILAIGSPAIPHLLPLLKHDNEEVRSLTSFILSDIEGLTAEHLDALIESRLNGDGWIPPAIASIGTPEAIKFLVKELRKEKSQNTQLTGAFECLEERGVPYLVALFEEKKCDGDLLYVVSHIFGELGDKARYAVEPLTKIAANKQYSKKQRTYAVFALGYLGDEAHASIPVLQQLLEEDSKVFTLYVNEAIVRMKAPQAVSILLKRLECQPDISVFRDIAALEQNGSSAGTTLVSYLSHSNWEYRVAAARAIGYIQYADASQDLIKLIGNEDNWQLAYVSIEALGRMKAKDAIPSLTNVSKSHWCPVVRTAALKALDVINGNSEYKSRYHPNNFALEFFSYENAWSGNERTSEVSSPPISKPKYYLSASLRKKLSYKAEIASFGVRGEIVKKIKQIPDVGIEVVDGYLVGSCRGEWGGELVFIDKDGKSTILLDENIQGIHHLGTNIVAVAGLAHLSSNSGCLYKIQKNDAGNWYSIKWKVLPGAPDISEMNTEGMLWVDCDGIRVIVASDGKMKVATD